MGRLELLIVVVTVLAVIAAAWLIKTGLWRRASLLVVTVGIFGGLALLTRRVGWGELVIVAVLLGIPFFLVAPARPRGRSTDLESRSRRA